jgi:hypothetical protein
VFFVPCAFKPARESSSDFNLGEISGSHGGEYEDDRLLEFCAVGAKLHTFSVSATEDTDW